MDATNEDPTDLKRQIEHLSAHYRRLGDSISEGVSLVTLDGVIASLSPAFESLTGWPTSQLIGRHIQALIHPADLPFAIEQWRAFTTREAASITKFGGVSPSGFLTQAMGA